MKEAGLFVVPEVPLDLDTIPKGDSDYGIFSSCDTRVQTRVELLSADEPFSCLNSALRWLRLSWDMWTPPLDLIGAPPFDPTAH
uniref:Uncharacterized protein n=1 Tax=Sphaerodactylus townsendi TaxID=933632 RepID=A0ACB8FRS3_9SAUR